MLKLSTRTKLTPKQVVDKALDFFGPGGYGLEVTDQGETCASFEGGGGGVWVTTCEQEGMTTVDMEAREWEDEVKEFARKIKDGAKART